MKSSIKQISGLGQKGLGSSLRVSVLMHVDRINFNACHEKKISGFRTWREQVRA